VNFGKLVIDWSVHAVTCWWCWCDHALCCVITVWV